MPLTKFWATITILVVSICSYSQCDNLLPISTTGQVIHHTYYCLSYDENHEQAEWTYHVLISGMLNGSTSRTDNFREDPNITTGYIDRKVYSVNPLTHDDFREYYLERQH